LLETFPAITLVLSWHHHLLRFLHCVRCSLVGRIFWEWSWTTVWAHIS